jgi:pimeloyl-ACP methyl ester carboxylesterase
MLHKTARISLTLVCYLLLLCLGANPAQAATATLTGTLADGATYLIEVPSPWNGTLLLYNHMYFPPGGPNPATDTPDPASRDFLLANGFALAGSSYANTGWAVQEALLDQMAVLDLFIAQFGTPTRTIAWGHSMGGAITAGLIQRHPDRFDGALPMCGVLSGSVAVWNQGLDSAFAFKTLFNFGGPLQVVHITDPTANLVLAEQILAAANATPQGRARLALANALTNLPGWFDPSSPEPAAGDLAAQAENQFLWVQQVVYPFIFAFRAELEFRAGGNPSWNTGVDYRVQFAHSVNQEEVLALYAQAGLSLDDDLNTLNNAARIAADPDAVDYLQQNIIFDGNIHVPVLAMQTEGDGLVVNQAMDAYRHTVDQSGNQDFLREVFVHRAGHCTFTPAETVAALGNLLTRLDTGLWPDLQADTLNAQAAALGPLNTAPPSFSLFHPTQFERPFDAFDAARCAAGHDNQHVPCNAF